MTESALVTTDLAPDAMVVYEHDFQSAVGTEWSHTTRMDTPTPGRYSFGPP